MATGNYLGTTSFRTIGQRTMTDSRGFDWLTVQRRGSLSGLDTEADSWTRGISASSLGYANMYLQTKEVETGFSSNFGTVTLTFQGFLSDTLNNPVGTSDSVTLQAGTFVSDELDSEGAAQNVQAQYMAQQTTTRWMYQGLTAPVGPRYPLIVPTSVPVGTLFGHSPASYTGSLATQFVGRLAQFDREELARGVWGVVESWILRVEPDV